ncbi:uncharacterized protein LOC109711448 isoform X1 [Ananas comosus]|uniref:Uncharacterized protein LOC109711448 isoform X1 n=1 Tax=Ananas comosus TaxID=4615 RepID=A0A6P5F9V0_ANACO|nr:uncharacterized protein LOC109711448 isoform X1 [Ananas comosus]
MFFSKTPPSPQPWRCVPKIKPYPLFIPLSNASSSASCFPLTKKNPRRILIQTTSSYSPQSPPPTPTTPSVERNRRWKKVPPDMGPPVGPSFVEDEGDAAGAEGSSSAQVARGPEAGVGARGLGFLRRRSIWRKVVSFVPRKVRSIVLLNVLSVIFASNICVVKEAEVITDPAVFAVVRFAVSAVPFIPFVLKAHEDMQILTAGVELGFWVSLGYLAQAVGLLTSDAGRASFISAFTVIIVPLIDGIIGAAVPAYTWVGAFVSLIGVAMLEFTGSPPCVGDILNLLSAVCFAIHMLRTEHISRSIKKENFLTLLGCEVIIVALFSTIWFILKCLFHHVKRWSLSSLSWSKFLCWMVSFPWVAALYTGIFSTGLCLWAELSAMRDVSATETAIIYGLEPVWGAAFAWFLLGERWGVVGWIGAALIIGSCLTVQILGSLPEICKWYKGSGQMNA